MNTTSEKANDREEIESLLPWHAAGTLSRRDAERVERALANDQELARRFDLVREELTETIHLNESLGAPSARAMEKLFAAIDAEGALQAQAELRFDLRTRVSEFFSAFAPRTLAFAGAAAALVIMLQAGVIGSMVLKSGSSYDTASAPDVKVDSLDLYVNFVAAGERRRCHQVPARPPGLDRRGAEGAGTYRVRFAVTGTPKEELARLVKELQQNRNIVGSEFEAPATK